MAADQTLYRWAETATIDGVTGIYQRKTIQDNEWTSGWTRNQVVSAQELNTLFYLLTTSSAPIPAPIAFLPDDSDIPDTAVALDGSSITESSYPNLYSIYGSTLPDASGLLSGYTVIVRASQREENGSKLQIL